MSDPQSEADKIRLKRLAKLGGPAPSPSSEGASASDTAATASSSKPNDENSTTKPSPQPQPKAQPPSKITITSRAPTSDRPKPKPRTLTSDAPIEVWTDRILSSIFRITLDPERRDDASGSRLYYAKGVREEAEGGDGPARLTLELVEQAIIEVASHTSDRKPLNYLLACWKRVTKAWRNHRSGEPNEAKLLVLKEARRITMSYCIFAATLPDMFDVAHVDRNPLADYLLRDPDSDQGICHEFLAEAVSRFDEDDGIKEVLVGAVETISQDLAKLTMNGNFKPYVSALRLLVRYPQITEALTQSSLFLPQDIAPEAIERDTLLGPFFAISPLHPDVALNYFMGSQAQGEAYVQSNQNAIRMTLRTHQDEIFEITNAIVKAGKEPRERILDWLALTVNKNHKRRAMQVDWKTVSTDGFMVNVTTILDRLCEPFMDATFSKLDRIDVDYLRRSPRVEIKDETKINADQQESDDFYANVAEGTNNFISEVFFLTIAAHHYGTEAVNSKVENLQRSVKRLEQDIAKMETERAKYATNPAQLTMFEQHLKRFKDHLEKSRCVIKAIQGILLDDITQQRSIQLMRYVIAWLLRLVQPQTNYPREELVLPLKEEQPLVFRCLPEYFVEDLVDNFKFITANMPHIIPSTQCEELVTVCIAFLRSSEYVKNPGLKHGLITILWHGIWPYRGKSKGVLGDLLSSSDFCHKHLLHSLMKFYIEAESTGASSQFYDKFNIRHEIQQIVRCIWSTSIYRQNLETEAKTNVDFFVHFVNLLLNDVTYVLGESFTAFKKISRIQNELEDSNNPLEETERQSRQEALDESQRMAKNYMQLTNETMSMLKLFTEVLSEAFTMPEIVQRLADMLDYNLEFMVGPKQRELKVREPEQYSFRPAHLLSDIMSVYSNLAGQHTFLVAVARDGRSYKPYNFEHAAEIMAKTTHKSPDELKTWRALAAGIARAKEEEDEAEEDLGDVPDEFLDPLMATLMEDPVILPRSQITVDRSTIRSHLLSVQHDPFNRTPLKIEDVIPNTDLKDKIAAFKEEARRKRVAEKQAATGGASADVMDTS